MKNVIKSFGIIAFAAVIGFGMVSCEEDDVDVVIPPEDMTTAKRWSSWDYESTATITHEVDSDGVCKITVGGTAMPPTGNGSWDYIWKAQAQYKYTAVASKTYTYTFEAWTESGDRAMVVEWYYDYTLDAHQNIGYSGGVNPPTFTINSTPKIYGITGEEIPKSGVQSLEFLCANQTGTFYVKNIFIIEAKPKKITITGITGKTGGSCIGLFPFPFADYTVADGNANISGSSVTFNLKASEYTEKNNENYGGWIGSGTYNLYLTFETDGYNVAYNCDNYPISSTTSTIAFNEFYKVE